MSSLIKEYLNLEKTMPLRKEIQKFSPSLLSYGRPIIKDFFIGYFLYFMVSLFCFGIGYTVVSYFNLSISVLFILSYLLVAFLIVCGINVITYNKLCKKYSIEVMQGYFSKKMSFDNMICLFIFSLPIFGFFILPLFCSYHQKIYSFLKEDINLELFNNIEKKQSELLEKIINNKDELKELQLSFSKNIDNKEIKTLYELVNKKIQSNVLGDDTLSFVEYQIKNKEHNQQVIYNE